LVFPAILASAYHSAGRFEDAVKEAQSVLDRDPDNLDALIILAASLTVLGRSAEARQVATRIGGAEPGFKVAEFVAQEPFIEGAQRRDLSEQLIAAGLS
jgi:tetratricopeptide (TPR) repeat protein